MCISTAQACTRCICAGARCIRLAANASAVCGVQDDRVLPCDSNAPAQARVLTEM